MRAPLAADAGDLLVPMVILLTYSEFWITAGWTVSGLTSHRLRALRPRKVVRKRDHPFPRKFRVRLSVASLENRCGDGFTRDVRARNKATRACQPGFANCGHCATSEQPLPKVGLKAASPGILATTVYRSQAPLDSEGALTRNM